MATSAGNSATPAAAGERYIQQQLDKTRWHVKLVDLGGALLTLAIGILGFLLVLAVVDAWILDLGFWGRLLALLILAGGSAAYFVVYVLPLLVRRINPVYAARAIEASRPSLKNSLVNFLLLRPDRGRIHEGVYQAVEHRAAADLAQVPIESAVDRSKLIKLGYALAGVMLVCGLYKVLSPKDPFQTVARVAAPLANLSRPARVEISDIVPGDATVFHGEVLPVRARIHGAREGESPTVYFSTVDGQIVDRAVPLIRAENGIDYAAQLSPDASAGIQQDLTYRIVAGDADTRDFLVRVQTAPTIVVTRVRYDFPRYVARPPLEVERQGDVRAIEGTQVTVEALANLPLKVAFLEFDPDSDDDSSATTRLPTVEMKFDGPTARGQFTLELRADRKVPVHSSYRVRMVTTDGDRNQHAAVHRIEVVADLPPEVEIINPVRDHIEVPENGSQTIEVRAIDPDYELSQVVLRAVSGGTDLLNHTLFRSSEVSGELSAGVAQPLNVGAIDSTNSRNGQIAAAFEFRPGSLHLAAGDEVVLWAVAADNRTSALYQLPEPNQARTRNYYIKITPRVEDPRGAKSERPHIDPATGEPETNSSQENEPTDGSKGKSSDGNQASPMGLPGKSDGAGGTSSDGSTSGSSPGSEPSDSQQSNPGGASGGTPPSTQEQSQPTDPTGSANGTDQGQPSGGQPQEGGPQNSSTSDGAGQSKGAPGSPSGGEPSPGEPSEGAGQNNEPLHDGEAIEKVLDYLKKKQEAGDAAKSSPNSKSPSGDGTSIAKNNAGASDTSQIPPKSQPNGDNSATNDSASPERAQPSDSESGRPADQTSNGTPPSSKGGEQSSASDSGGSSKTNGNDKKQGDGAKNNDRPDGGKSGESGVPGGADETRPEHDPASDKSDAEQNRPGQGDNGTSGAGQGSEDQTGAPQSQNDNRDRDKQTKPGGTKPTEAGPESPSTSKKQSDSQGEAGDQSGGGGEGGGQGANQAGNDSAGSNSPGDTGAGAADQSGMGETSSHGGSDESSSGKTGSSADQPGGGSHSRENPAGDSVKAKPGQHEAKSGGAPGGGGWADRPISGDVDNTELPPGEKANLEYARQATDLALEQLRHQKDNPDRELLDELGWTKEELQSFLERWQQMQRGAKTGDPAQRQELDRALRSLGLRPDGDKRRAGGAADDSQRGLRDAGQRSLPPPQYQEQFNAFIKGASRAEE